MSTGAAEPPAVEVSAPDSGVPASGGLTARVKKIFDTIRSYGVPRVSLDRSILFTQSFELTEGQPMVLRWARALKHFAEQVPVTIFEGELIVGRPNTWHGRWGLVYAELDAGTMPSGVEMFLQNQGQVLIGEDDKRIVNTVLTPYWSGRDYATAYHRALPEDTRFMIFGPDPRNKLLSTCVVLATAPLRHSQNWTPDFSKILTRGCEGIREAAREKLNALEDPRDFIEKAPFLDAVIVTCDAMSIWSRRYARLAESMAAVEKNPRRKKELLEIAAVCHRVPEHPARSFHEALQAQWWGQLFNRIEQTSGALGQGRMDQYLYPYYQRDIEEGKITRAAAKELLECLWLQMSQCGEIKLNPMAAAGTEGFSSYPDVVIGGQTPDGTDAANELSYLILDSVRRLQTPEPDTCVRIHSNTPDRFLHAVVEAIKDGRGSPKLLNDERVIPFYLANGATLKQALDWNISGCCENRLINRETHVTGNGGLNYGSTVEMTFRNGKLRVLKDTQFGLKTGDPRGWTSFDDVWKAFCAQLGHQAMHAVRQQFLALKLKPAYFAAPATSMLHDLAMEQCRDLHTHGDYFPGAIDHSCLDTIGKGTAIDSLAAVKHLLFDTGQLTWEQLLEAMERNWDGADAVRRMCLDAPKYGRGIEWVDRLGFDIETFLLEYLHNHSKPHAQSFLLRCIPATFHAPLGKVTWATPNGRLAGEHLSEGISDAHGMDGNEPAVTLISTAQARNLSYPEKGADFLSLKYPPAEAAGEEGTHRLMHLIRAWSALKHWHLQLDVLDRQTLLDARQNPGMYRDLVVRFGGYSAYFTELSPGQQAEIIARPQME